ncbi:MAG: pseudaminic acid cytidylyltransferase [Holosporales bacterium]|jgi:N-acylneuraminate cytidylyltransferase|nr:pseudaminic acid cytidylyltransferase [Holosporales bacterium]
MQNVAIVTARGGSKRIPKKNIKEFFGKPIIAYPIVACVESGIFDEVMVSTDCPEIANVSKKYGANVPFMRSQETSSDQAPTFDVLEEVIYAYKDLVKTFNNICCIMPCAPFLTAGLLKNAYDKFAEHDALMPVCRYSVPVEWVLRIQDGLLIPDNEEAQQMRSQDLKEGYFDAGMFYFCKTEILLQEKTLVPPKTLAYVLPESMVQDIDTEEDWKMAELKYRALLS